MLTQHCPQITGQINRTHHGLIQLMLLQHPDCGFQGTDAGTLFTGKGKAGAADLELTCNPAGHNVAQAAHGPVGVQGWADAVP